MFSSPVAKKKIPDCELFSFAVQPDWKDTLDSETLSWMEGLIADYNEALNRIRRSRVTINNRSRQNDVNRILYSMGKELSHDSDSLYSAFAGIDDEYIAIIM